MSGTEHVDELVTWLRGVLDEMAEDAPHRHFRGCEVLGNFQYATMMTDSPMHEECDCSIPQSVLARVEAERMILNDHEDHNGWCQRCEAPTAGAWHEGVQREAFPCPTIRALAYGHRFDAPGYRPQHV